LDNYQQIRINSILEAPCLSDRFVDRATDAVQDALALPVFFKEPAGRKGNLNKTLETIEQRLVHEAMAAAEGHQTRAAEALGLNERMLRYKLKKYGRK